jgi:hypothetical protein
VVNDYFSEMSVRNASGLTLKKRPLRTFLDEREESSASARAAFQRLDDLVAWRNEVAHGGVGQPSQSLQNPDILEDYLSYIEAYGESLFEVLKSEYLSHEIAWRGLPLGRPIAIYGSKVICVALDSGALSVDDRISARLSDESYRSGKVRRLEVDNKEHTRVTGTKGLKVGVEVDFSVKENQEFYLIREPIGTT